MIMLAIKNKKKKKRKLGIIYVQNFNENRTNNEKKMFTYSPWHRLKSKKLIKLQIVIYRTRDNFFNPSS